MDFDKEVLCETIDEVCRKNNLPILDRKVVRLIVEVAADCFDLGYQAARREMVEDK